MTSTTNNKRTPTFFDRGRLLTGRAAIEAWRDQPCRCNCGDRPDRDNSIAGSGPI